MHIRLKRSLGLILLAGLLLAALLRGWTPQSSSTVDIKPRRGSDLKELIDRKIHDIVGSDGDIPYHTKESLARIYSPADELIVAEANSPLQYPTQGIEVQPLKTVLIPGLGLKEENSMHHTVYLKATLGAFDVAATVDKVDVQGEGQSHMTLSSPLLPALNRQLQFVTYTNTVFHPKTADTVLGHEPTDRCLLSGKDFPPPRPTHHQGSEEEAGKILDNWSTIGDPDVIAVKPGEKNLSVDAAQHVAPRRSLTVGPGPGLWLPAVKPSAPWGTEYNISALVTIATKTFLRYEKLNDLINSIRKYYSTVTIVIADDNEHPKPVRGPHIEHYIMPFGKGWFAGRNLAVSQVTTKYILWVDDDFIFTENTKLEKMVDILEKTTLDLVGGAVREVTGYTATFRHTISVEEGGEEGGCLHIRNGYHHYIEGFPSCVVADAIINFFMGRTDRVREVGFDPKLAREGHLEFFVDALGSLHIGSCSDIIVNHASKIKLPWTKTDSQKAYEKFRYPSSKSTSSLHNGIYYFKNRFKCMSSQ
ncbi:Beta-1,4 N-acetylgalactosaminyltransferase 1 [Takifugu flavidus]|uniref:Beta-1,4 N-acetylgalactosaminyltransferase n=1 Tax=Takifugu flavidus TaxID=433684 RepID=A0A5C6MPC8_9TELE|nr:Beta-1,4 N-acetylgalactosaminyltransferase 1 [Takifugu flavidus]